MKLYHGRRTPDGCEVTVADENGVRDLPIRHDVRKHADGFNWSFNGGGSRQLSLAILCDALGDTDRAQELSNAVKMRVFAVLVQDEWTVTLERVLEIVACLESGAVPA